MTDIGFGLINRRTVITVLFCMVISVSLLNNNLPINTTNAGNAFVDLVIFTGYILIMRSILRLPFALLYSFFVGVNPANILSHNFVKYSPPKKSNFGQRFLLGLTKFVTLLLSAGTFLVTVPYLIFLFGKWIDNDASYHPKYVKRDEYGDYFQGSAGKTETSLKQLTRFFDRAGLIFITFLSTLPSLTLLVKMAGELGIVFSLLIFLIRGDFSFAVKDNLGDKDHTVS